jgi:NAD(P)H-dependent FMN reductase
MSEYVAKFVVQEIAKRDGLETLLIDIRKIPIPITDAGESLKDPEFSATAIRVDALIIVVPEYNHGYLKF